MDAWERRKRVTIAYWRVATDEVVERQLDVHGWASRRGEWIVVGHDSLRNAVRVFHVSRIRKLKVNTVRAQNPDYSVPADFDIRRWSRQQIWDYDVHAPQPAVVRFRGSLARIAKQLLPAASVTTDEAGFRVARLEVRNLRGLVRQILAWGPETELVEPAEGRPGSRASWSERASADDDGTVTVRMRVTPGNYLFGVVLGHGGEATVEGPADVVEKFRERLSELAALYGRRPRPRPAPMSRSILRTELHDSSGAQSSASPDGACGSTPFTLEQERSVTRTSQTDPIRVDFVPQDAHGLCGRLGITFAPGKCGQGMYATWDRNLRTDLKRLRDEYRTDVLVTLLEPFEMTAASIPNLGRTAKRAGLRWISFPITDMSVPADIEATIALVRGLLEELATGRTVVVHCMGGLGRAGTIASCCLAACGVEAEHAIAMIRTARPGAVQTAAQEAFVYRLADLTPVGSPPSIHQARAVGTRTRNR